MEDAILLDEAFYPLVKLHCPPGMKPNFLKLFEEFKTIKEANKADNPALAKLEIKKIPSEDTGTEYTTGGLCQNTVDARDFFRMFTSVTDRTRQFILTPLKTEDGIDENPCKVKCFQAKHTECTDMIRDRYEKAGVGIRRAAGEKIIDAVLAYEWNNNFDSLGNLLVCPPTTKCPDGAIIYGNSTPHNDMVLDFTWTPECVPRPANIAANDPFCTTEQTFSLNTGHGDINPDLLAFFGTNFGRQPVISVYTGWLEVGHIDEVISFVKHDGGEFGFKMLINSPALFIDMWTKANSTTPEGCLFDMPLEGSSTDYTTQNQLLAIKAGVKYPYSGFMLPSTDGCTIKVKDITTLTNLIRFNHFLQAIIDKIQEKLCHQLGLRPTDVIKLPILFTGPDELYNSAIKSTGELFGIERGEDSLQVYLKKAYREIFNGANIGGVYHLSSNLANSIISPTFMICDTPHSILPIKEYMKDNIISPGSITHIYYADTWDTVKYQHGGLHCFTGETRDFTARATVTRANGAASSGAASSGATSYNANYNKVNKNIHALTKMVEEANMREAKAKNNTARNAAKQDKNNALGRLRSLVTDFISKYPAPPKQAAPPEQAGGSRRNKRSRRQKRTRRVRRTAKYRR